MTKPKHDQLDPRHTVPKSVFAMVIALALSFACAVCVPDDPPMNLRWEIVGVIAFMFASGTAWGWGIRQLQAETENRKALASPPEAGRLEGGEERG